MDGLDFAFSGMGIALGVAGFYFGKYSVKKSRYFLLFCIK